MKYFFILSLCASSFLYAGGCFAAPLMPSPAQIEQFKSLSPEEQQALAKSVGIDTASLSANSAQPQIREAVSPTRVEAENSVAATVVEVKKPAVAETVALKPFGADLFSNGPASFTPASDIPIPSDYVMGPGDNIVIQLYGKENNAYSLTINREGQVQFPEIGPISLAGLSFSQAQANLGEVVEKQMIGVKSSITMGALRTIRIFVLGEVIQPGSFTVGALSTMTNALFASGGINKVGSFRNIQLKRQGKVVTSLDLYDLLLRGDTSSDARLMPGDVLFVPPRGETITVMGAVTRPAIYELQSATDVAGALSLAGGANTSAYLPESRLERIGNNGEKTLLNLDLTKIRDKAQPIKDGDVLRISSVLDIVQDKVTLRGHIKRAEEFAWTAGARFSDAIPNVDALLPNPDIDVALIQRELPGTRQIQIQLFSPKAAWAGRGGSQDPQLHRNDTLYVFNFETDRSGLLRDAVERLKTQSQFKERQKAVGISGSVRFPGTYPLAENMRAQDLIMLAGGLTESALGTQGEITRYDFSQNMERVVMHLVVDLSDPTVALQAADTLQIKQIPLWKNKESVTVGGEVIFPGTYSILPGETLMDVLTRAGGLTPHAHAEGAVFSRKDLRELEDARIQDMKKTVEAELAAAATTQQTGKKDIDISAAQRVLRSLEASKAGGRLVIDLPLILKTPNGHDFQMEDGDTLTIPRYKPSVTVVGEVQFPTSHFYNAKLSSTDYINNSGGMKKNADTARIYVVKANGTVITPKTGWLKANKGGIQPGDTIVVPLETDKKDTLEIWAKASQIIYNSALGAAALVAIK
ncbi:MAG: hypothetical protein RL497_1701 [Pseudomonadota bacterium]